MKISNAIVRGCCVGGIEVVEQEMVRVQPAERVEGEEGEEGEEQEEEFIVFPSQGHPIQFDDPYYDPYADPFNGPFNTTPQPSPVPEYTSAKPEPVVIVSPEVTELDDGRLDQKDHIYYQIVEELRKQNTNSSTEKVIQSAGEQTVTPVKRKKDPLPIEVDVTIDNSEHPEGQVEKQSYSADWVKETKSGKKVYRNVDVNKIKAYRVYKDPEKPDPRKYQEMDLNVTEMESPRGFAEVLTGREVYEEYPQFQYLNMSKFKRLRRFLKRLCCCIGSIEPELPTIGDNTTLHVLRSDFETETQACRAIRQLRIRRKTCYI